MSRENNNNEGFPENNSDLNKEVLDPVEKIAKEVAILRNESKKACNIDYSTWNNLSDEEKEAISLDRYNIALKAINILNEMSLINFNNGEVVEGLIGLTHPFYSKLNDLFYDSEYENKKIPNKQILGFLPTLNLISQIEKNYLRSGNYPINILDIRTANGRKIDIGYWINSAKFNICKLLKLGDEAFFEAVNTKNAKDLMNSLKILLTERDYYSMHYFAERGLNFLEKHRVAIEKAINDKRNDIIKDGMEFLEDFFKTEDFELILAKACQDSINNDSSSLIRELRCPICERLLKERIAGYGLDPDKIISAWLSNHTEEGKRPNILENIKIIQKIEQSRKGSAEQLFSFFGIRNFERYSPETLLGQVEEMNNLDKPYGIMLNPISDHNGAFSEDVNIINNLTKQLHKRGFSLRIIEAESKSEISRKLIKMYRTYGEKHKISFIFLGGHGEKDTILFGGKDKRHSLTLEDLEKILGRRIQKAISMLGKDCKIVLLSCSTGERGGIAQKLSSLTGTKIIAPSVSTGLHDIEVVVKENNIDFKIDYSDEWAAETYINGQNTKQEYRGAPGQEKEWESFM